MNLLWGLLIKLNSCWKASPCTWVSSGDIQPSDWYARLSQPLSKLSSALYQLESSSSACQRPSPAIRAAFSWSSGSFCSARAHWGHSAQEKRLHAPLQERCYLCVEVELWLILVVQLRLVLTSSDVVRISIESSISGELAFILPILSAIPNSFSDLSSATQERHAFPQALHLCVLQDWHAIASLSFFNLFHRNLTVFDFYQYIHIYKLGSNKEPINCLIGHFHPEVLSNVQIFRGPLPACVATFFSPFQLLASQNTMMTGSKPCYFGPYPASVSSVSFLIQLLS